ncbi:hypothetical protein F5X98DRAFT_385706 [Xylaria grammica]|nr:hypothetical protein F5X98DRAFT_385706 [Xylaria grammica]
MTLLHLFLLLVPAWATALPQTGSATDDLGSETGVLSNYSLGDLEWRGFADFNPEQVFTGTIQNVIRQMREIKGATYTPEFVSKAENQTRASNADLNMASIECMQDMKCDKVPAARHGPARAGVTYLWHLPDTVMCQLGPSTCGRISCSWNAGILWCNDKAAPSNSFKCKMFAGYAAAILGQCSSHDLVNTVVGGKNSDYDLGVSVIVEYQRKC